MKEKVVSVTIKVKGDKKKKHGKLKLYCAVPIDEDGPKYRPQDTMQNLFELVERHMLDEQGTFRGTTTDAPKGGK